MVKVSLRAKGKISGSFPPGNNVASPGVPNGVGNGSLFIPIVNIHRILEWIKLEHTWQMHLRQHYSSLH